MSNKLIIILAIIMMFNFISIPKQSAHGIDPLTLTLGALYTYEVAQALYLTILTATAIGVSFATVHEWKKFHDVIEGTSPGPIEQYPEWEVAREQVQQSKSDLSNEHWFSQWELESLPGGGGDPDPGNNNKKGILAFMGASAFIMGGFVSNFLTMFRKLDSVEGENLFYENPSLDLNQNIGVVNLTYDDIKDKSMFTINIPSYSITLHRSSVEPYIFATINNEIPEVTSGYFGNVWAGSYPRDIRITITSSRVITEIKGRYDSNWSSQGFYLLPSNTVDNTNGKLIAKYNIKKDSSIFDDNSSYRMPQPNLIPIPRSNPTIKPRLNPDGSPKKGMQTIVNPDGSQEDRYYGDVDDLIKDVVMNTPIDDILNPDTRPYEIEPGPDHIKITYPDLDPTVPYPQPGKPLPPGILPGQYPGPGPYPFPDPTKPPGILPGQYPGPGPYPGMPPNKDPVKPPGIEPGQYPGPGPYPYPDPSLPPGIEPGQYPGPGPYPGLPPNPSPNPNPSPQTPLEPGMMIDYTPWLQIIINWLSKIWIKIPELPEPEPVEEMPPVEIDFSPLMGIELTEKFPFSLVSDVKKSVNMLTASPEPPYFQVPMVDKEIIIDFEGFDKWAVITRNFLSLTFIIVLVLITRRFIG